MKIKLKKKVKASEKKKFIYRDKSYDWEDNYYDIIKKYVEADWSYDQDNRHNLCDGVKVSDIVIDDIRKMLHIMDMGFDTMDQQRLLANINKAISRICKENSFSNKKTEREAKRIAKEKEQAEKQAAKEAKLKLKKELPDLLFKFINDNYGSNLSYNISNYQVYWQDRILNRDILNGIIFDIKQEDLFKTVSTSYLKTVINNVANLHQFEEKIVVEEDSVDNEWNILKNVDADNWTDCLVKDTKGYLSHNVFNYACFLTFHPQFKGNLSYSSFNKIESLKKFDKEYGQIVNKPIDDDIMNLIKAQIEQYFGDFNTKYLEPALSVVMQNNSYHEIRQKFNEIEKAGWDGKPRLHKMMVKYFGCEDRPEIHEMTEVMMIGSVQRIIDENPDEGFPFDFMGLMLGKQGTGKTKFMTRIYFGDNFTTINPDVNDDQKFTDLTNRAWLVLFDEMKSIAKADMGTVKSRITEQGANVRLSYGRRSKYYPRHVVFWGNTNYRGVLRDEGYERRFLCFECHAEVHTVEWWEKNFTDYDIEQIWAETLKIYHDKYEGKILELSQKTKDYNYLVQIRHKVWVEDSRTDLELKEILNYKHYNKPYYEPEDWRAWMKLLDELKLNNTLNHGQHDLKIINCKWVLSRLPRKEEWITGMVESLGWKKIHVNNKIFGDEDYYIRGDLTFDDIIKDYESYVTIDYVIKDDKTDEFMLPFD